MPDWFKNLLCKRVLVSASRRDARVERERKTYSHEEDDDVATDKRRKDTKVPPAVTKVQAQRLVELVAHLVSGPAVVEEGLHVVAARLALRRREGVELGLGAGDLEIVQRRDDHAADEAREGVELVEPGAPEAGHLRGGDSDTAEEGKGDHDEGIELRRDEGAGRQGGESLSEGDGEELGDEDHEELVARAGRVGLEARHVVQGQEEGDGAHDGVRQLGDGDGGGKGQRVVHLGRRLAEEEGALDVEHDLDLADDEGRQDGDLEHDEDLVLQRAAAPVEVEVGETGDEGDNDVVKETGEEVVGAAPEAEVHALHDHLELVPLRASVLLLEVVVCGSARGDALLLQLADGVLDVGKFGAVVPNVGPVLVSDAGRGAGADGLEHVLGDVVGGLSDGAVALQVVAQDDGVLANVAKVDGASTPLEQQETVKVLKQGGVGLVDRAENGLSGGGQLPKEAHNVEGALAVQTGGGLVEEEEELGLGGQLDTNGDTLALLDRQAELGRSNNAVGNVLHLKQGDDLLDVRESLRDRGLVGLAEEGGESEGLADGLGRVMKIELLGVRGASLELLSGLDAVNEDITVDNTNVLAGRKHVEKGGLACTGSAHQCCELAGLDVSKDVVEETTGSTRNGDIVVEVLPGQDGFRLDAEVGTLLLVAAALACSLLDESLVEPLALLVGLLVDLGRVTVVAEVDEFSESDVHDEEEDDEGEDDAPVAPQVALEVVEPSCNVGRAVDEGGSGLGARKGANLVVDVAVAGARGDERVVSAGELEAAKLVLHHGAEGETKRVDPVDPSNPLVLRLVLNEVARCDNEESDQNDSELDGVVEVGTDTTDDTEEQGHGDVSGQDHEVKRKESPRLADETRHEVDNDREDQDLSRSKGLIDDDLGNP
ncbi:uncharacterized protein ColSpa_09746 [Colletotrichum spaethianum]|uniref:Uncharacterized protein n=1 Tax=Colletotrichum spaethianum TaxID=700344 RepID=A0AA37PC60_9PEZI|nr:uncharacterized protein ColSpa_09746 [Colletotrichum spaethianum]GKT49565.1 hypothetical protein ColSpa_09746 [Colletotrichum spaethianum]